MSFGPLVSAQWLVGHLGDPRLVLVDCRYDLTDPAAGRRAYDEGHIPGAAFLDTERDLCAPARGIGGRHPLPEPTAFERSAGACGIDSAKSVVAYDTAGEGGAARLWWLLRHFGHRDVAVLDGGLHAYCEAGGVVSDAREQITAARFFAQARTADTVEADELCASASPRGIDLVDARSHKRFRGEKEPIDPRAGHIPGARNVEFFELAPNGRFLAPAELGARLLGPSNGGELVAYCGSGLTACTVVLAAELCGISARLYPGSWSDWCARGLAVATGDG